MRKKTAKKKAAAKLPKGRKQESLVPFDKVSEIVDFLEKRDLEEFEFERDGLRIRLKRQGGARVIHSAAVPLAVSAEAAAAPAGAPAEAAAEASDEGLHLVNSPIVGTYYEAPRPGAPPFVKVGDNVTKGQTLCIVEAMKLMNEIESDVDGEIVRIHGSNAQPVEYGAKLFAIRPK